MGVVMASLAAISDQYNQRSQQLESALAKATHFQDELMVSGGGVVGRVGGGV